jgi:esterase/lipase superfamily enzyme
MRIVTRLSAWLMLAVLVGGCGAKKEASAPPPSVATESRADDPDRTVGEPAPVERSLSDNDRTASEEEAASSDVPPSVAMPAEAAPEVIAPRIDRSARVDAEREEVRPRPRMAPPPMAAPGSRSESVDDAEDPNRDADERGYVLEKIYYGTDRAPQTSASDRSAAYRAAFKRSLTFAAIGLTLFIAAVWFSTHRVVAAALAVACLLGSAWFARSALLEKQQAALDDRNQNRRYGHTIHIVDGKHVLERGICWVSVPAVHVRGSGELEAPRIFELSVDPKEHFQLQRVQLSDRDTFLYDFRQSVQGSTAKHAFVFIHGYNVDFREAALRTAQLRYDLDFDGPAALFSWPSNGEMLSYATDEETVNLTVRSGVLNEFLTDLIDETGVESIHLIAHSMGNRALTRAFEDLPDRKNSRGEKRINQLIMAAPDVNPAEFRLLAERIEQLTRSRTLYASEKDIALIGSEILRRSTYTRLGQGGAHRVVIDGVQTIDASNLDQKIFDLGHSYYVHPLVMRDLKHLLNSAQVVPARPWLLPVENYWEFLTD